MTDDEEAPSPVKGFLSPLGLGQHRDSLKALGYDDPKDFASQTQEDARDMKAALLGDGVPPVT